jgi:DNA-binding NarL/FixJ family response regulator
MLSISPRTAKNHVANILSKLGLSNRIQAAVYAVRRGLV